MFVFPPNIQEESLSFLSFHIMVSIPRYDMLLCWMDHPPRRNRKETLRIIHKNQSTTIISNSFFGCFSDTCKAKFLWSLLALNWFVWLGGRGGLSRCSCDKRIGRSWGRKIARGDRYGDAWRDVALYSLVTWSLWTMLQNVAYWYFIIITFCPGSHELAGFRLTWRRLHCEFHNWVSTPVCSPVFAQLVSGLLYITQLHIVYIHVSRERNPAPFLVYWLALYFQLLLISWRGPQPTTMFGNVLYGCTMDVLFDKRF